jgi:hypothetical protein
MDARSAPVKEIMNRFMWINKDEIRLINKEGVEKIVELANEQKEKEYNVIPLFKYRDVQDPLRHYFTNRIGLRIQNVLKRL